MNEDKQTIKPGKNLFIVDGPIGRMQLLITYAILLGIGIPFGLAVSIIVGLFGLTKYTQIAFYILLFLYITPSLYVFYVASAKRLYDIIGNKKDAIFYTVMIFLAKLAIPFIPFLNIPGKIFTIIILAILLLLPGKYILPKPKQKEIVDEEV